MKKVVCLYGYPEAGVYPKDSTFVKGCIYERSDYFRIDTSIVVYVTVNNKVQYRFTDLHFCNYFMDLDVMRKRKLKQLKFFI